MSVERQVHWGQGAFLSPQHLQAQDAWQQANRHALHLRLTPFPWGYEALRLREDALGTGVIDVQQFVLVTRDGERLVGGSVDTAAGNTRVPQRNIAELVPASNDPIPVWLVFNRDRAIQGLAPANPSGWSRAMHWPPTAWATRSTRRHRPPMSISCCTSRTSSPASTRTPRRSCVPPTATSSPN